MLQRVGHHGSTFNTRADGHVNLYGKLVTVGVGHHALWQLGEDQSAYDNTGHTASNGHPRMIETLGQQYPIVFVQNIEQVERLLAVCARLRLHGFADEEILQDGQQRLGDDHRGKEHNRDGPGEG